MALFKKEELPAAKDREEQLEKLLAQYTEIIKDQLDEKMKEYKTAGQLSVQDETKKVLDRMKKDQAAIAKRLERMERMLAMQYRGITEKKRETQIIVTFTSYGKRIQTVPLMLERVLNQTLKPDRIVLYLSEENFPKKEAELPERLLEMQQYGLEIHWCKGDIRSFKKLIPALKEFPEDILITLDDDIYYDLDVIERLYDSYKKNPRAISALRVHKITFDEKGQLIPYREWPFEVSEPEQKPTMGYFATTGAGTLFPPHILPEETCREEIFKELCPNADDVWVKVMAMLNRVPIVPPAAKRKLTLISGTQEKSLWATNQQENDEQIANVLNYYANQGRTDLLEEMNCD